MKNLFSSLIVLSSLTSVLHAAPFTLLSGVYRYTSLSGGNVSVEGGSLYSSGAYTASFTQTHPASELATLGLDATSLQAISGKFVTGKEYIDSELATAEGRDRLANYTFSKTSYPTDRGTVYLVTPGGFTPKVPTLNVTVAKTSIREGGQPTAFVITLSKAAADELIVRYTLGGTAKIRTDYTGPKAARFVEIPKGVRTFTIPVRPADDTVKESSESLIFQLAKNDGYKIGAKKSVTIRITDND
jgi:hypothetical protein